MVLGLMFGNYSLTGNKVPFVESYPEAYRLAKKQHNLNIWTDDMAIIGTNLARWGSTKSDDDPVLQSFVKQNEPTNSTDIPHSLVKLGDFAELTNFLKAIIGIPEDERNG